MLPLAPDLRRAETVIAAFEAARTRGEDRALVDGLRVEAPTYRDAKRMAERAPAARRP